MDSKMKNDFQPVTLSVPLIKSEAVEMIAADSIANGDLVRVEINALGEKVAILIKNELLTL